MGSALGFSLTQPTGVSLAIFTMLGLGMAAPFVLLTNIPALVRFLPKPGRWMETLKQFMGFLLMATVIWLAWVLGVQGGYGQVILLLGALLAVGLGAWILGRWGGLAGGAGTRYAARLIAGALIVAVVSFTAVRTGTISPAQTSGQYTDGKLTWEPYSQDRVDKLRKEGQPLLIDFTAAWCLSCKVNERVAFNSDEVQNKLIEKNVTTIKADWTNRSTEITQALAAFGRNSVPLYVLYSGNSADAPIVLPEILTPRIVLDALEKI
jgi:thiol:disulfide interchange protein DsbD